MTTDTHPNLNDAALDSGFRMHSGVYKFIGLVPHGQLKYYQGPLIFHRWNLHWCVWFSVLAIWLIESVSSFAAVNGSQSDLPISLATHGDAWRYHKGTNAPQSGWQTLDNGNLDDSWATGIGGYGYADNAAETNLCQTILGDMRGRYTTLYMRQTFAINSVVATNQHLMLTMDWDDGFIAWLDGNYIASANVNGAPAEPAFTAKASSLHESSHGNSSPQPEGKFDLGPVDGRLSPGTHTIAIMGINESSDSSDFIQIADLSLETPSSNIGVSGAITLDTFWRAADSPIHVTGNVTVSNGVTLVIEPGCVGFIRSRNRHHYKRTPACGRQRNQPNSFHPKYRGNLVEPT